MQLSSILQELKRELAVRQRVYPDWISNGKLTADTAQHRIDAIKAAIVLLEKSEPQQQELF